MIYQNRKSKYQDPVMVENYNKFLLDIKNAPISNDGQEPGESTNNESSSGQSENQVLDKNKIINDSSLDLTIFSSEKFKELKENILIPRDDISVGKRDIFQPN